MKDPQKPSLRKPFGVLALISLLSVYAAVIVRIAAPVSGLPALAQLPVWLVLGVLWIPLAMPLVRWIETGRFQR